MVLNPQEARLVALRALHSQALMARRRQGRSYHRYSSVPQAAANSMPHRILALCNNSEIDCLPACLPEVKGTRALPAASMTASLACGSLSGQFQ